MKNQEIILIVHNVRSAYNVGSMFRTAEVAGVSKIFLSGYSPKPIDKFRRKRKDIAKTALGAEDLIPWEHYVQAGKLIKKLKKEGFFIIGLEQAPKSIDYKKVNPPAGGKTALIVGNEVRGLSGKILERCNVIAEIPMQGKLFRNRPKDDCGKESLNVAVALGIAIFRIFDI